MIVCACQGRDSTEGSVSDLKQEIFSFLRVNWNPTQHVAAFFCLPPAWLPVPSGLFVETKSELHTKFFVLCSSWKSLSEGFSPEPQREVSVGFNREYLRKKISFRLAKFLSFSIHCHYTYFCTSASKTTMSSKCIYNWKCCYCPAH